MEAPLTINDLPPAVLARIFTLTDPRRDGLALLLTCRYWLAVAEAQCPQHLWGSAVVHIDDERLLQQHAQAALLAGLRRRAAWLTELSITAEQDTRADGATATGLAPLWPVVLRVVERKLQLSVLEIFAAITDCAVICKALGSMTSLRQLQFSVRVQQAAFPLPDLHPLSALTQLERLELWMSDCVGELPANLLPVFGRLTSLGLHSPGQQSVAWQRPDGTGPSLRQLSLWQLQRGDCQIGMPPDRLLPALQQLERLQLFRVSLQEAQFGILPQLPRLTSLDVAAMRIAWPAVLQCAHLQELVAGYSLNPPPAHFPPGSLPQLTRLTLRCEHASPAWLALPQLRSMELTDGRWSNDPLPSLGQCLQLEELEVWGRSLHEVTQAASSLTRLTRLVVLAVVERGEPQGLHQGPYLASLRQLKHSAFAALAPEQTWRLPAFLAGATSLELLKLKRDSSLRLCGAEDAALLRTLPRLRRVLLPCRVGDGEAAAAVKRIQEGLQGGVGEGTGPSHAVEVEGFVYTELI